MERGQKAKFLAFNESINHITWGKVEEKTERKRKKETNTRKKAMVALLVFTVISYMYFRENFKRKQLVDS